MAEIRVKVVDKLRMKPTKTLTETRAEKPFKMSVNLTGFVAFFLCFLAAMTEGLHLDGTKQTYVKYPKWQVRPEEGAIRRTDGDG